MRRVAVKIEGCGSGKMGRFSNPGIREPSRFPEAKVTVRDNKRHTIKRLKWSERDSAFVGTF